MGDAALLIFVFDFSIGSLADRSWEVELDIA